MFLWDTLTCRLSRATFHSPVIFCSPPSQHLAWHHIFLGAVYGHCLSFAGKSNDVIVSTWNVKLIERLSSYGVCHKLIDTCEPHSLYCSIRIVIAWSRLFATRTVLLNQDGVSAYILCVSVNSSALPLVAGVRREELSR